MVTISRVDVSKSLAALDHQSRGSLATQDQYSSLAHVKVSGTHFNASKLMRRIRNTRLMVTGQIVMPQQTAARVDCVSYELLFTLRVNTCLMQ